MKKLLCSVFHRNWRYGPVEGWPSSKYQECATCGRTWATGTRSWYFFNKHGGKAL